MQDGFNKFFYNYSAACAAGFFSCSQWKKRGRIVLEDAVPSIVVRKVARSQGRPINPVIEELEGDIFLFVDDGFCVYSVEQTLPKAVSPCISINSSVNTCITPPHPSSPITMLNNIIETNEKPHNCRISEGKRKVNKTCKTEQLIKPLIEKKVYNPTNLDLPESCKEHEEAIRQILHIIHYRHCIEALPKDEYVPLKAAYLRRQIPAWNTIKRKLLRVGIVETDHHYIEGQKCYGFRAGERWRESPYRLATIKTSTPKESDDDNDFPLPVHTWLKKQAQRIAVAGSQTSDQLQMIQDGLWQFNSKDGFGWRFHSNLTHLKTEARKSLRVHGKPLVEIDIKNSQPLFLAKLLKERGIAGSEKYIEICQQDLYGYLAGKAGVSRAEAKAAIIETVLFARLGAKHPIKTLFKQEFPEVWKFIEGVKKKDYKKLACLLQRAEAQFVIYSVCERIRREFPETFVATIHDSILHLPRDSEYIRAVLEAEFAKWGLKPRLEVKNYADD